MANPKGRVSIPKEDRIWSLRCQGYDYDTIARITNVSSSTPGRVIRRVGRRPPLHSDPIKRGRKQGFFSDHQIYNIRLRYRLGEKQTEIAKEFGVDATSINKICCFKTYCEPCQDNTIEGYKFSFGNRLIRAA
jgi:transposase